MAKPAHVRLTLDGVVGTKAAPVERWSHSLSFPAAAVGLGDEDAALFAKVDLVASRWNTHLSPVMPQDVVLTGIKMAHVGADGLIPTRADGSYIQGVWDGDIPGGMAKQPIPLQTALCVSLTTGRAGPTGKGRFFLPWPALSLDADDKLLPVAQVEGIIDNVKGFVDAVAVVVGHAPQVVSSKGYMSEVLGIRIGRAPDTMRSRREDAQEGYLSLPLA